MRQGAPALEAVGLTKAYAKRTVVDVDHLFVAAGEVLGVLGPNGAGKSTLFRLLALLEKPDEGEVRHFGERVTTRSLLARRSLGAVFQRPLLFQGRVRHNVAFGLKLRRVPRRARAELVDRAMETAGVGHLADAEVRTLSGGELQRVALARAVVVEPRILFLDEPTSSLDLDVRRQFREDLRRIVRSLSTTVVLITHDLNEALALSDSLAVVRDGRIVQSGLTQEVFAQPRDAFVASFMGVETIWTGRVAATEEGVCRVATEVGVTVELIAGTAVVGDEVTLSIRPEDVLLEAGAHRVPSGGSSVRNHWPAVVESVTLAGPLLRVGLSLNGTGAKVGDSNGGGDTGACGLLGVLDAAAGRRLVALVTRPSGEEMGLEPGLPVTAAVKATAIRVLERGGNAR